MNSLWIAFLHCLPAPKMFGGKLVIEEIKGLGQMWSEKLKNHESDMYRGMAKKVEKAVGLFTYFLYLLQKYQD